MMEFTLFMPTRLMLALHDELDLTALLAGGDTRMYGAGRWAPPGGTGVVADNVVLVTYIVSFDTQVQLVQQLRRVVVALHALGEHTVLVRRLSGRGIAHFWLKAGEEDQL